MYSLEVIICSGLFYGFYRLVLEGRVAHRTARVYLVLSVILAVIIPMLELPILPPQKDMAIEIEIANSEVVTTLSTTESALPTKSVDWMTILLIIYTSVSALILLRVFAGIVSILRLRRRCTIEHHDSYNLAVNSSITKPFSFWKTIFIGAIHKDIDHILLHEQSHITHNHTAEKLFIEFARSVMWLNPFIHLTANSLAQVQEWEADSDVLSEGVDIDQYRKTIFHQLFGYTPDITCGLNSNLTKKRFIMMTQSKRGRYPLLRLCAVIPIVVAIILAFGSVNAKPQPNTTEVKETLRESGVTKVNYSKEDAQTEPSDISVTINNDSQTQPEEVAKVKEALRESGVTKVNYSKEDAQTEQSDISVTINSNSQTQPEEVAEVKEALRESGVTKVNYSKPETTTKTVKKRNILIVDVKADGSVFVRGEQFTNENKLKREVKRFIHNFRLLTINTRVLRVIRISGGRQYEKNSEFTTTAVKMGEGVSMACPVSKGIVSINSELPMGSPVLESVSNTIYEAFMELREKMAHRIYGKSYDKLDEAQKAEIGKVVPINISLAVKK